MDPTWLPSGFRPLQTQVAGHTFLADTDAVGLLQDADTGCVLKPLGKPVCGKRELNFYETLEQTTDPVLQQLRAFVPRFHHQVKLVINQRELVFLKLENLTYGMQKPCIMDIKIGRRTWDPEATPRKIAVEEEKYMHCKQPLGLCIPGFQMYKYDDKTLKRHGKEYGKKLNVQTFRDTIKCFFNVQSKVISPLLREVLRQLLTIQNWFSIQTKLHFYASSLLIAYDFELLQRLPEPVVNGFETTKNQQLVESAITQQSMQQLIKVRMIDFAHVFPAENCALDTNYIFGLQNLIVILKELLEKCV